MKTKKCFFTLMLALALAVCMAVPAFASNEDSNFMTYCKQLYMGRQ